MEKLEIKTAETNIIAEDCIDTLFLKIKGLENITDSNHVEELTEDLDIDEKDLIEIVDNKLFQEDLLGEYENTNIEDINLEIPKQQTQLVVDDRNIIEVFDNECLQELTEVSIEQDTNRSLSSRPVTDSNRRKHDHTLKLESTRVNKQRPSRAKKKRKPVIKQKTLLECFKCGQKTYSKVNLIFHLKTGHVWERTCPHCGRVVRNKGTLRHHIITVHEKIYSYECAICEHKFAEKRNLTRHLENKHGYRFERFTCDECKQPYKSKSGLRRHKINTHCKNFKILKCDKCDFSTTAEGNLKRHIYYRHKKEPIKCPIDGCNFVNVFNGQVRQHIKEKHTENAERFHCAHCKYETTSRTSLRCHMRTHRVRELICCLQCDFKTRVKSSLLFHIKYKHDVTVQPKKCPHCDYENKNMYYVKNHILRSHDELGNWLTCIECDFKSRTQVKLGKHMKKEHGPQARVYKCSECIYKSENRMLFMAHFSRRHGETHKWHNCSKCEFKTKYKHVLRNHVRVFHEYSKLESFICHTCGHISHSKINLESHIANKHSKLIRVFHCLLCDDETRHKATLKKHLQQKHGKTGKKTDLCLKKCKVEWIRRETRTRFKSNKRGGKNEVQNYDPQQFRKVLKVNVVRLDLSYHNSYD